MNRRTVVACAIAALGVAGGVSAQPAAGPTMPGRVEVSAGPLFGNGFSLGSRDATETANTGGTYRLFATSTELAPAAGMDVRVGLRVTDRLTAEAFGSYARPELRTRVGSDAEGAAAVVARETIHQMAIGGGGAFQVGRLGGQPRLVPFVAAGAAYLRELHDGLTLVQTGQQYTAGGGVKIVLRTAPSARLKSAGVRVDVRAAIRTGGIAFDTGAHVTPQAGAALFVRF